MITFVSEPSGKQKNDREKENLGEAFEQPVRALGVACVVVAEIMKVVNQVPIFGTRVDFPVGRVGPRTGFPITPLKKFVQHDQQKEIMRSFYLSR